MDAQTMNNGNSKSLFRILVSAAVSILAAEIVFVIFWSFKFISAISDSLFLSIGVLAGMVAGIISFIKIDKYLKDRMQNK